VGSDLTEAEGTDAGEPEAADVHARARATLARVARLPFEPTPPCVRPTDPPPRPGEATLPSLGDMGRLPAQLIPAHPPSPEVRPRAFCAEGLGLI
jgi:hypothetical protein